MPLHWTIDPEQRLVTVVAEGEVKRAEVEAYLNAVDQAGANGYRKLFDGTRGDTSMGPEDVLALGVRMRAAHATGPMGPLAMVVPGGVAEPFGRMLGMLASAERPMRVFREVGPARKWIGNLPR
ncbi:MAG: hypothetical protein Q8L22_26080 [Reyranella sp.]|nr:hypothetical protein [Reyranella sp.]